MIYLLREFEKLATIPIGQTQQQHQLHNKGNSTNPSARPSSAKARNSNSKATTTTSKPHLNSRLSRGNISYSTTELMGTDDCNRAHASSATAVSKRAVVKATDRSQIQEELKSVLTSTIDLTKVLQDQLHELKLKGWNFASRANAPPAAQ